MTKHIHIFVGDGKPRVVVSDKATIDAPNTIGSRGEKYSVSFESSTGRKGKLTVFSPGGEQHAATMAREHLEGGHSGYEMGRVKIVSSTKDACDCQNHANDTQINPVAIAKDFIHNNKSLSQMKAYLEEIAASEDQKRKAIDVFSQSYNRK